ncbi:MAG: subclass B1 metallo-beta-lactamase [Cyclobacteriaceae bacterium]|nr:subclass B1 metallo-beta-lactamase [Cyclobacteriaceae bacterium]
MMKYIVIAPLITSLLFSCGKTSNQPGIKEATRQHRDSAVYETGGLIVKKLSGHVYQHITFLNTQSFGRVPCNGMVVINGNEAIVFDTPADDNGSAELLDYLSAKLNLKVTALIATHFHADCVGGLKEFHKKGIPSYANRLTIRFLNEQNSDNIPQNGFDGELALNVGDKKVYASFSGEGHTRDNVVGYFPDEHIMFGGCLVKEVGAGKGNLEDADTVAWSGTIVKLKAKYPEVKVVIPGHGKTGGVELLDYTEQLFQAANHP